LSVVALGSATTGCTTTTTTPPEEECDDVGLCLAPPESGLQVKSEGYEIEAGTDVEYCEVVALPGDPSEVYYINRFEVAMTQYSHHLIVSAIEPGTETDMNANVGDRVPCTGGDVFGGEIIPVTGSQQPYNDTTYPDRVGRRYYGGQKLVFDYHYYNTSSAPIRARAAVNFHTTTEDKIERLVQTFGMINLTINTPPMSDATFKNGCTLHQETEVFSLIRHTHRWGTDFDVWFKGGERDGKHVFHSADYEDVEHRFETPIRMKPGEGFDFSCSYTNTESYPLTFGLKATDEMCILFGDWYVPFDMDHEPFQDGCFITK
jgi:hypothetical protein